MTTVNLSQLLDGFESVAPSSLPNGPGVYVISCELGSVHALLHAEFADDVAESAGAAMQQHRFHESCSGALRYLVLPTTDTHKGAALAEALSRFRRPSS